MSFSSRLASYGSVKISTSARIDVRKSESWSIDICPRASSPSCAIRWATDSGTTSASAQVRFLFAVR
jgi:hypothetical protein